MSPTLSRTILAPNQPVGNRAAGRERSARLLNLRHNVAGDVVAARPGGLDQGVHAAGDEGVAAHEDGHGRGDGGLGQARTKGSDTSAGRRRSE